MFEPILIESSEALRKHCQLWRAEPALALDTEFVRTRTFYAQLGLVQVGSGEQQFLVDAVAVEDLSPLADVLRAAKTVKVVHSGAEDLEVLFHRFGFFPEPIFDTQLAAVLAGYGSNPSYQRLVAMLFALEIPKGETRSDWMHRPLSEAQIEYATLDVAYLLRSYEILRTELLSKLRLGWAEEEFRRLIESTRARTEPEYTFNRLRGSSRFGRRELAILQELCEWRELEARRRDLPRGFVLTDETLLELVRRRPTSAEQLRRMKGLRKGTRSRHGADLVARIAEVMERPARELPDEERARPASGRNRGKVDQLRNLVAEAAAGLEIPPEFLARRRLLEELVRNVRSHAEPALPEELRGWRQAVIGDRLLEEARRPDS